MTAADDYTEALLRVCPCGWHHPLWGPPDAVAEHVRHMVTAARAEGDALRARVEAVLADPPYFLGVAREPLVLAADVRAALTSGDQP